MIAQPSSPNAEPRHTPTEAKLLRRYRNECIGAALVYVGLLFASLRFVDRLSAGPAKVAVALLPMLGVVAFSIAMLRFLSHLDEFQRQTTLTAAALAGLVTAIVTMALGFLENAGVPRVSMTFVWPLTFVAFGVCLPFVRRRYR
jgi:hypothetical protein